MQTTEVQAIQALFHIQNKDGARVPFILSPAQLFLDKHDNPTGRARVIIAKARQKGFSRGILAKFAIRCLGREGTHAVVISHESSATQRLLDSVSYYFKHMNGPPPQLGTNSRKEMTFPIRDSAYYIGTAGSRTFGRGDTITDLHCSEYAFWEDTKKLTTGLFQAVPYSGRIYIESTGNGRNNDFFYTWQNADKMNFTRIFFSWFMDSEYSLPVASWRPELTKHASYMLDLQKKHNLTAQQMAWYEWKLAELREDLQMMQQEYPSEPEECFQATGGAVFPDVQLTYNSSWQAANHQGYYVYRLQGHPKPGLTYVLGADPSGGTGNDDAGLVIFCANTGEQVFELVYNTINPIRFAELVVELGFGFNQAFVVCESNNHGAAVIPYLKENYPRESLYKRKLATRSTPALYGWNNSQQTKHALIGTMQEGLDQVALHGSQTVTELKSYEENEDGKLGSKSDNLVIAAGLAMLGLQKFQSLRQTSSILPRPQPVAKPDYSLTSFEEIMAALKKGSAGIGRQAGVGYPLN